MQSALREEYLVKRRVTLVCAALNLLLAVTKLIAGVLGHSQALVADGIHSLSDLASDFVVLAAAKIASTEADEDHPYGHARFETVATIVLGVLLLLAAAGVVIDAVERIANPEQLLEPGYLALSAALVSILVNEWMYRYSLRAAKEVTSDLMRANAWHHRSDALSSVIAFAGIAGTMAGFPMLDALGAIGVALLIAKIGWSLAWTAIKELVDTGVDPDRLRAIADTITAVEGVESFHELRTRRMGQQVLIEAHVLVDSEMTVSEGHMIADRVEDKLLSEHEEIRQALIHVDPEDDELEQPGALLPGRDAMMERLRRLWEPAGFSDRVERINLHYLGGKINVEIVLPLDLARDLDDARAIAGRLEQTTKTLDVVGRVNVLFK